MNQKCLISHYLHLINSTHSIVMIGESSWPETTILNSSRSVIMYESAKGMDWKEF